MIKIQSLSGSKGIIFKQMEEMEITEKTSLVNRPKQEFEITITNTSSTKETIKLFRSLLSFASIKS